MQYINATWLGYSILSSRAKHQCFRQS
jgi:hypothetical protein